jgi:DNA-binding response OmpR family regulator
MSKPLTILVADPSPVMRRFLELTFAREGMQVLAVGDGDRLMDLLPRARPDVVIADHALPGRDGYEIAAFVRGGAAVASLPIVLTAGAFETVDRERASRAGCEDIFVKPFDPNQLVARVRQLAVRAPAGSTDADSYFEQLSAALDARDRVRPRPHAVREGVADADEGSVPTLDSILKRDRTE